MMREMPPGTPGQTAKMDKAMEEAPISPSHVSPKLPLVPENTPVQALRGDENKPIKKPSTICISTKDLDPDGDIAALRKAIRISPKELEPLDEYNDGLSSPSTPVTPSEISRPLKSQMPKYKSLSAYELNTLTFSHPPSTDDLAKVAERLKNEEAPMSLEQARQRRASIKEDRKKSIEFIRSRTNSRAAMMGRPAMGEKMDSYREVDEK